MHRDSVDSLRAHQSEVGLELGCEEDAGGEVGQKKAVRVLLEELTLLNDEDVAAEVETVEGRDGERYIVGVVEVDEGARRSCRVVDPERLEASLDGRGKEGGDSQVVQVRGNVAHSDADGRSWVGEGGIVGGWDSVERR